MGKTVNTTFTENAVGSIVDDSLTLTDIDDLKPFQKTPKGELTIVISENNNNSITLSDADKKKIKKMIKNSSVKDIVNLITKNKEISKKEVYHYCLSIKK